MDRLDQAEQGNAPAAPAQPSDLALAESLLSLSLNNVPLPPPQPLAQSGSPLPASEQLSATALDALDAALDTKPAAALSPKPPRTAVVFQPACAKHRYIRNSDIGTIVERPERLRAVKTGVAAVWARLEMRNGASGGQRWAPPTKVEHEAADELDDLLQGLSLSGGEKRDVKGKGRAREVLGGPFDILDSSALIALDDAALRLVHSKPNRPPNEGDDDGWTTTSSPSPPPDAPGPSTSPSRQTRTASRPSSPSKRSRSLPWPAQLQDLCRRSSTAILNHPFSEIPPHLPQGDLYLCEESEQAIFGAMGAVCEGVDRIVESGEEGYRRAFVAIRPPGHHCGEANPQGFCFVNNVAVAAAHAYAKNGINRVIILDIDLHHGNGTQEIVWQINAEAQRILAARASRTPSASPRKGAASAAAGSPKKVGGQGVPELPAPLQVMYGSLHDIWSYPCEDGDPALVQAASLNLAGGHGQWISNVHLEPWSTEEEFYRELYPKYRDGLLGSAEEFCRRAPGGIEASDKTLLIVSAGFDASEHESAGMSRHARNVPTSFYRHFALDAVAFSARFCADRTLAVLEGGYSDRALASATGAFLSGFVAPPAGSEVTADHPDEHAWWAEAHLKKLEKACAPASTKARRGGASGGALRAHSLVGADSSAEPWLVRAVEVFAHIEESAAPLLAAARTAPSSVPAVEAASGSAGSRQLRERKVRHNYAGLDEGSTPLGSPARTPARRSVSASRNRAEQQQHQPAVPPPIPPVPPVPTPFFSAPLGPSVAAAESVAHAVEDAAATARPAVRFTWKQGGFDGAPRM
ncbi:histone deacetylase [Rhodotorula paludigena]|uniref:histone deacetylase n=1 Tax=Rhodotorula paludigena TaxID=86838 RepID=UPI0031807B9E